MKLFVGIDVSSQELEACFMNADGDKLETLTVKNNLNGASHLRDQIVAAANKLAVTEIHIGLEATSVYSWHPAMYLHQDPALRERKANVITSYSIHYTKLYDGNLLFEDQPASAIP